MEGQREKKIKDYLREELGLTEKRVLQEYQEITRHKDIADEFYSYIIAGWENDLENKIKEEGYTARELHECYPLSVLGAYNFLIYLRENPNEAIEYLKKGLPRK